MAALKARINEQQVAMTDEEQIVMEAYQTVLGRPAEPAAIEYYGPHIFKGGLEAITNLYRNLADSDEFLQKTLSKRHLMITQSGKAAAELRNDTRFEAIDFATRYPRELVDDTLARMKAFCTYAGQLEYIDTHFERFCELFGLVTYFANKNSRMLEISTSPASSQLKNIFKGFYATFDHPGTYPYNGDPNPHVNSDKHFQINLNAEQINEKLAAYNEEKFDLVLFTEIIEHLLKSPYDLVDDLAACLRPGGHLFISTPNLFSHVAMRAMALKMHPTAMLLRGDNYARGGKHVREYTMIELKRVIKDCGLELVHFSFSDCWDKGDDLRAFLDEHPEQRSCMYVLARKPAT